MYFIYFLYIRYGKDIHINEMTEIETETEIDTDTDIDIDLP